MSLKPQTCIPLPPHTLTHHDTNTKHTQQIVTSLSRLHLLPLPVNDGAAAEALLSNSFLPHAGATTAALFLPLAGAWLVHRLFQRPALERAEAATGIRFGAWLGCLVCMGRTHACDPYRHHTQPRTSTSTPTHTTAVDGKPVQTDFVHLAYGYLPLAWAANTASWGEFFLREVRRI